MPVKFENNRLTELKFTDRRKKFLVFDIEANNWIDFLMAGVYDGENYYFCPSIDALCYTLMQRKYEGWIIYSHYGGAYDMRFILDWIFKNRPDMTVEIIESQGVMMSLDVKLVQGKKTRHWRFYDSYQVIKGSLDQLTKTFDVEHRKLTGTVDRGNLKDTPETRKYLEYDCLGLYEVIEKFYSMELLDGVNHKMSTASLAMNIFRVNYLQDTVLYKLPEDKEKFVRLGYYGGRNEIFKMAGEDVNEYDINSMYVAAMCSPLPCGTKGIWQYKYNFIPGTCAFIDATVTAPSDLHIPLLPYKDLDKKKLTFPLGTFRGVWFSAELQKAQELGYKITQHQALVFKAESFLADYAQDCWSIRQNNPGANPLNFTAKLFGNGLYGKFAQERDREKLTSDIDPYEAAMAGYSLAFPEYNLWRVPAHSDSVAILPYISAAITSYSRLILYSYLEVYPENVLYCDTDSVFLDGGKTLPSGKGLGQMKHENSWSRFVAIQPKFYLKEPPGRHIGQFFIKRHWQRKTITRAKGFQFDAAGRGPWQFGDFIIALITDDYDLFYQVRPQKLSKLNIAIKNRNLLHLCEAKRSVRSTYDKRIINDDFSTSPNYINTEVINND